MKTTGRILALILVLALALGCAPVARAESTPKDAADRLHSLGLFQGTGTDRNGNPVYELERTPTRAEAIVMLVRLLGAEAEAKEKADFWSYSFRDVPEWAAPYVGYAYYNHLTNGYDAYTFGSGDPASAAMYITFLLRALGYSSESDFVWDSPWAFADSIGLTDGRYGPDSVFTRGDVALLSSAALDLVPNGCILTLLEQLDELGAIHRDYSGLVSEVLHLEGTVWSDTPRLISIPRININSGEVQAINTELAALWNRSWNVNKVDYDKDTPIRVEYRTAFNEALGILALVVHVVDCWGNDLNRVYNVTLEGVRVTDDSLLAVTGGAWERLEAQCRSRLLALYDEAARTNDGPLTLNQIAGMRQMVETGAYPINAEVMHPYVNQRGDLCCVVRAPWYAGSGWVELDLGPIVTLAQAKAAGLWEQVERCGGYNWLSSTGNNMEAFADASKWAYQRIYGRKGIVRLIGLYISLGKVLVGDVKELATTTLGVTRDAILTKIYDQELFSRNDVMYFFLELASEEGFQALADAHRRYDPQTASDSDARAYLRLSYAQNINYETILMTYYYFYDQNAKTFNDYRGELLLMLRDDFLGQEFMGNTAVAMMEAAEKVNDAVLAEHLLRAVADFATGKPAALLKWADEQPIKEIRRWGYLVQTDLSELRGILAE